MARGTVPRNAMARPRWLGRAARAIAAASLLGALALSARAQNLSTEGVRGPITITTTVEAPPPPSVPRHGTAAADDALARIGPTAPAPRSAGVQARADDGLVAVPALTGRVIDRTGTLTRGDIAALDTKLAALEKDKGSQVVILMVPTTQPEDIAAYANRVGNTWKIGRKNVGDGLLIVVAKDDRRMRIEVAKTLEGAVPDIAASHIINEVMRPAFRANNYAAGLDAAVDQVAARIRDEPLPAVKTSYSTVHSYDVGGIKIRINGITLGLLSALLMFGTPIVLVTGRPRWLAAVAGIVLFCVILALLALWLWAFWWILPFFLVFALLARFGGGGRGGHGGGASGRSGSWSGSSSGGFGSSGGFSSGGGGDFGGGGASGSW